jgi:cystathionine beta-lyase
MSSNLHPNSRLIHPRPAAPGFRSLSVPVHQASTVVFESLDEFDKRDPFDTNRYVYGLAGTPTTNTLAQAVADWEGGYAAVLTPSGLAAVSLAIMSQVSAGDHVLLPANVYAPARSLLKGTLARMGVTYTDYPWDAGAHITRYFTDRTRVVWVETPGSITLEVADLPAIAQAAHARGAVVITDNTWSSGSLLRVFDKGANLSVQALTKYHGGHGDVLMGAVIAPDEAGWRRVRACAGDLGLGVSGLEASLVLRGMQTMAIRLKHLEQATLELARWLQQHDQVVRVLHPALPECPGHATWLRDFRGSSSVFSIVLHPRHDGDAVARMLASLQLFQMGASWGGTASLALAYRAMRGQVSARDGSEGGHIVRLNVGLEDLEDLKLDLRQGLDALARA